jgi:hypothetical protein
MTNEIDNDELPVKEESMTGHNNPPQDTQDFDAMTTSIADNLAKAIKQGDASERSKEEAGSFREKAYQAAHDYFEALGLPREGGSGKVFRANGNYLEMRRDVCNALSKKLKDVIVADKKGNSKYTMRVDKQWSRLVKSYTEDNGTGTQSTADVLAKAIAKLRNQHNAKKAELLDMIVAAAKAGDQENLNGLMTRAVGLVAVCDEEIANVRAQD